MRENRSIPLLMLILKFMNLVNSYITNDGSNFIPTGELVPMDYPQTDVGSFMVHQSLHTIKNKESIRDVFIYWREIKETGQKNTSHDYYITCTPTASVNVNIASKKSFTNYVKFVNLSTIIGYTFFVYASNEYGLSTMHSTIDVPSEQDRNPKILSLTKILKIQNVFCLSWNNNDRNYNHDYTLFWCEKNPNRPYKCKEHIDWTHISGTESSYFHTIKDQNKTYNFAISENRQLKYRANVITTRSSGMIFESCSVLSNNILDGIESIYVDYITSASIEMSWIFQCSDTVDGVTGYQIVYCDTFSKQSFQCAGSITTKYIHLRMRNRKNAEFNLTMYGDVTALVIAGLQPETTYKFHINANSNIGVGARSNPILITTRKSGDDPQNNYNSNA